MMIEKRILVPDRVRQPPGEGFSWIDRRFLHDFAARLSHDGILLYFFLAAVSDKHGLSFYRDSSIAVHAVRPSTGSDPVISCRVVCYDVGMARPVRIEYASAIYHVMARGNARHALCHAEDDYQRMLTGLEKTVLRTGWERWVLGSKAFLKRIQATYEPSSPAGPGTTLPPLDELGCGGSCLGPRQV